MQIVDTVAQFRSLRARLALPVGFVPTMGALHAGHLALVQRARAECGAVAVSIFVNPLQFGPNEDFARYPRAPERDCELLSAHNVDVVFMPSQDVMFPITPKISVDPGSLAMHFEAISRAGHFRGVATVVLKLLNIVAPEKAYFGKKDAQQLAIIRRMVRDFDIPVEIVGCDTVRDADGLALSSRNAYLSADERRAAGNLSRALRAIADGLAQGQVDIEKLLAQAAQLLPPLRPDYLGVVRPDEFQPLQIAPPHSDLLAVGAAFAGNTRLIDNIQVQTP